MTPVIECLEDTYNISKNSLKKFAFKLLNEKKAIPSDWLSAIKVVQSASEKGRLSIISNVFSSLSTLREDKESIEIKDNGKFFDQFISLIRLGKSQSISIKGHPGVGKSTFLTIIYLHMLWELSNGKSQYVPLIFDAAYSERSKEGGASTNVKQYFSCVIDRFNKFLAGYKKIKEKCGLPVCLLIDGLEKSKLLAPGNDSLEKRLYQAIEKSLDSKTDKYVMCFNSHVFFHFDDSFEKINRFSYVLYMNEIRIFSYKSNETKQDSFLSNYLQLSSSKPSGMTTERFKSCLTKFHKPSIDLFFLCHFEKHIFAVKKTETIWTVMREHLKDLSEYADRHFGLKIDIAREVAGLLFSKRKRYSEIESLFGEDKLTIYEFQSILNLPEISDYLIAGHYINNLIEFSEPNSKIPENSILFSFIPNSIALIIRLLLDEKKDAANDILSRFIQFRSQEFNGYLYSMVAYLCGHLRTEGGGNLIKMLPPPKRDSNEFFDLCNRRSYDLATAVCKEDTFPLDKTIIELFNNVEYRRFNRSYQLHYYQDTSNNGIGTQSMWDISKAPKQGFDFRNSFLILYAKLEPALSSLNPYPLMELDLFTLCDLVYSRLQDFRPDSFFYSSKYNMKNDSECEAVLVKCIELLEHYNKAYGGKKSHDEQISAYFSLMLSRLKEIKDQVVGNSGKNVAIPYVSLCYDYSNIIKLSEKPRVGWNINTKKVEQGNEPHYTEKDGKPALPVWENIMQHVMESVYIALFFLPDDIQEPCFQKSKVISLLLLSELGKVYDGDHSPVYSNERTLRSNETEHLAHLLTLGALDGYGLQPVFFRPFFEKPRGDINMQICWEIKMIQMEYKYYKLYDQLKFNPERREDFEKDFEEPTTGICKKIREQLILKNPDFKEFFC